MTVTQSSRLAMLKRYGVLAYGAFGTMLDVGLMVLGSLLVGLSVSVLLAGLGIVDTVPMDLSTGAMLVSGLVLAVVGLFCLGLASEGPLGRGRRLVGYKLLEVGIGRTIAVFLIGLAALAGHDLLEGLVDGLPAPLHAGVAGLRAVAVAGLVGMPLVGVPLSLLLRGAPVDSRWLHDADVPVLFVVWVTGALIALS
ncbi:MAG: hypothetical protein L0Z49_04920 [Actinobacteria bacterium]|nr:hypothetical protein [Actinomycetota bacterium]MCI0543775.1 hypothetical protein [Actinomycetota bacterium]MCI0677738.1 hypothetical protein [Actinomycetota bacterium]